MNKKLTVIMRTYNRANTFLRAAIEGVLNQSMKNFEFIIYNNGSTDNTDEVVKSYSDNRIHYIKEEENIPHGKDRFLKVLDLVSTPYMMMTHDDDVMLPDMLKKELEVLEQNDHLALVACNVFVINEKGEQLYSSNPSIPHKDLIIHKKKEYIRNYMDLKNDTVIWCPTAMVRMDIMRKIDFNFLDETVIDDVYEWFQINELSEIGIITEELYEYRMSIFQGSMNQLEMYKSLYEYALPYMKKHCKPDEYKKCEKKLFDKLMASRKNNQMVHLMNIKKGMDISELEKKYQEYSIPTELCISELARIRLFYKISYLKEKYKNKSVPYVIYGAGTAGQKLKYFIDMLLPNFICIGFLDTFKEGELDQLPIYKYEHFDFSLCNMVMIGTTVAGYEISELLEKKGLKLLEDYIFGYGID